MSANILDFFAGMQRLRPTSTLRQTKVRLHNAPILARMTLGSLVGTVPEPA